VVDNDARMEKDAIVRPASPETVVDVLKIHEEAVVQQADLVKNFGLDQNAGEGYKLGRPEYFLRGFLQIKVSGEGKTPIDRALKAIKEVVVLRMSNCRGHQTGPWFFDKDRKQWAEEDLSHTDVGIDNEKVTGSPLECRLDAQIVAAGEAEVFGRFNKTNTGQFFFDGCRGLSARGIVDTNDFTTFREVGFEKRFNAVNSIEVTAVV